MVRPEGVILVRGERGGKRERRKKERSAQRLAMGLPAGAPLPGDIPWDPSQRKGKSGHAISEDGKPVPDKIGKPNSVNYGNANNFQYGYDYGNQNPNFMMPGPPFPLYPDMLSPYGPPEFIPHPHHMMMPMGLPAPPPPPPAFPIKEYGFFSNTRPGTKDKHVNSKVAEGPAKKSTTDAVVTPSHRTVGKGPNIGAPGPYKELGLGSSERRPIPVPTMNKPGESNAKPNPASASIHELFGKMVWKKMENLKNPVVVDRLQTKIMDLIADAIFEQENPSVQKAVNPEKSQFPGTSSFENGGFEIMGNMSAKPSNSAALGLGWQSLGSGTF